MGTLIDIRKALQLSQSEFANQLGLHQSTISRFECGALPVDKRTLLAAKALLQRDNIRHFEAADTPTAKETTASSQDLGAAA